MSLGAANAAADATTVAPVQRGPHAAGDGPSLAEMARRLGPLPCSAVGPVPGWRDRPGPEVAEWLVDTIDRFWHQIGRPDPFTVVDVGAADGSLARQILGLGPECLTALRYVLVEADGIGPDFASHALVHGRRLAVEVPSFLFPPGPDDPDDPGETPLPATGIGPLVTSLGELPRVGGAGVIFAYDWMWRLAADRFEWSAGRWAEVRLVADDEGQVTDILAPLDASRAAAAERLAERHSPGGVGRLDGSRFASLVGASTWLGDALRALESGVLIVGDRWTEVTEPLDPSSPRLHLAVDQLSRVRQPLGPVAENLPWGEQVVTWRLG